MKSCDAQALVDLSWILFKRPDASSRAIKWKIEMIVNDQLADAILYRKIPLVRLVVEEAANEVPA